MRSFQYKIINNVLFLTSYFWNKVIFTFYQCDCFECLWLDLVQYFQNSTILPTFIQQAVIFEIFDSANNDFIFKKNKVFINPILQIFKSYVYKSREKSS